MLLLWTKLDSPLTFPDFDGQQVSHLERKIEVATRPLGHSLPTATVFRKELEIRNKRQEGSTREAVTRALFTALQYYQAPTLADTYSAYNAIGAIVNRKRGGSPVYEERSKGKGGAFLEQEEDDEQRGDSDDEGETVS